MKIEHVRDNVIKVLSDSSIDVDLLLLDNINPKNADEDIEDFNDFISRYITKYKTPSIKIDFTTSSLQKNTFIFEFSTYLKQVTPDTLERLGAVICKLFGCNKVYVTKKSHDQGIDIIGEKDIDIFSSNKKSYIIGQSKNYVKGLVDVKDVRELAGSINLLRYKEFSQQIIVYPDIIISSLTPIRGIFVTSYFFSESAEVLCDKSHILPLNFIDVVCIYTQAASDGRLDIKTNGKFDIDKLEKYIIDIPEIS